MATIVPLHLRGVYKTNVPKLDLDYENLPADVQGVMKWALDKTTPPNEVLYELVQMKDCMNRKVFRFANRGMAMSVTTSSKEEQNQVPLQILSFFTNNVMHMRMGSEWRQTKMGFYSEDPKKDHAILIDIYSCHVLQGFTVRPWTVDLPNQDVGFERLILGVYLYPINAKKKVWKPRLQKRAHDNVLKIVQTTRKELEMRINMFRENLLSENAQAPLIDGWIRDEKLAESKMANSWASPYDSYSVESLSFERRIERALKDHPLLMLQATANTSQPEEQTEPSQETYTEAFQFGENWQCVRIYLKNLPPTQKWCEAYGALEFSALLRDFSRKQREDDVRAAELAAKEADETESEAEDAGKAEIEPIVPVGEVRSEPVVENEHQEVTDPECGKEELNRPANKAEEEADHSVSLS